MEISTVVLAPAMWARPALTYARYGARELQRDPYRPAARGFVTVTICYRLSGEAKFPAAIRDANAASYGIDPGVISITGHSAGGKLHLTTPPQVYNLARDPAESTNIAAAHADVVAHLTTLAGEIRPATGIPARHPVLPASSATPVVSNSSAS